MIITEEFKIITPSEDAAIASIIRRILKAHRLDIPGTAFFDESLDHLSSFYNRAGRAYYVLVRNGTVLGGIGFSGFSGFENCCELQKLYLDESAQGAGAGYEMIRFLEQRAAEYGYERIYLETHTSLQAAIHIYEKSGYRQIDRPKCVIHSAMNLFYLKELKTDTSNA